MGNYENAPDSSATAQSSTVLIARSSLCRLTVHELSGRYSRNEWIGRYATPVCEGCDRFFYSSAATFFQEKPRRHVLVLFWVGPMLAVVHVCTFYGKNLNGRIVFFLGRRE